MLGSIRAHAAKYRVVHGSGFCKTRDVNRLFHHNMQYVRQHPRRNIVPVTGAVNSLLPRVNILCPDAKAVASAEQCWRNVTAQTDSEVTLFFGGVGEPADSKTVFSYLW